MVSLPHNDTPPSRHVLQASATICYRTCLLICLLVGKLIFGDTSKESMIELPQGQLYLVRPLSPKGYSELIFKDAAARIRRTGQEYQYQLVIQRAYEEGEEELGEDADGEDEDTAGLASERDEKTFLLDESLHFRSEIREGGERVLAWRDLSGDPGDLYEFVCDNSTQPSEVRNFRIDCQALPVRKKISEESRNRIRSRPCEFFFYGRAHTKRQSHPKPYNIVPCHRYAFFCNTANVQEHCQLRTEAGADPN